MFSILRPYIFSLDPEVAHDLAIKSLKANILPKSFFKVESEEMLETNLLGKTIALFTDKLETSEQKSTDQISAEIEQRIANLLEDDQKELH